MHIYLVHYYLPIFLHKFTDIKSITYYWCWTHTHTHIPCDNYALTTYTVHARFYPFVTRWRTFFVRSIHSSSVYFTVLTCHNTSLYLLLIRLSYGLIRYTSVFLRSLSVCHPLRFVQFCQIWHRIRTSKNV